MLKRGHQAPKSLRNLQSDDEARASPRDPTRAPSQVVGVLVLSAKAKRGDEIATSRDDVRAQTVPNDQRTAMETDLSGRASFEGRRLFA